MKKTAIALIACCIFTGSALFAECPKCAAQGKKMNHAGMDMSGLGCPRVGMMIARRQELKLSDEQVNELKKLQTDLIRANARTAGERDIIRADLAEMMADPAPDLKALKEQMKKLSELELQMDTARVDCFGKASEVLKKDQKTKFGEMWGGMASQTPAQD